MKLRVIFIVMVLFCTARISMVAANDTMSFTDNLKDCKEYYGSQTIDLQDIKLTTVRQIQGKYTVKCLLSKEHIADLVKTMDDFEKDESSKNIDLNDFEQVQNSTVVTGWSKYLQNPEICTIETQ